MTIYTVMLITQKYRVNEPQVWVFTNPTDAESFSYKWMYDQINNADRSKFADPRAHWLGSYDDLEQHCIDRGICRVDIQSHLVRIPRRYND